MSSRNHLKEIVKQKAILLGEVKLCAGKVSNYYINYSKVTNDSEGIFFTAASIIEEVDSWSKINNIGGPAYGALPLIYSVLPLLHESSWKMKSFFYRKEQKEYGNRELIEGEISPGDKILLLEDVVTTGGSVLKVVNSLKKIGCEIVQIISMVDRGEGAAQLFEKEGIPFKSVLHVRELL